ncbi:MAG TPA: adenylosuccinate lyase [Planctomycetota bacterium]|nr:adenylosuccinate lyase [Planctomycetota bacterium]
MTDASARFEHPLLQRYASAEMSALFSPRSRHGTWRTLWIVLAEAQRELGLPITAAQIEALRAVQDRFDWQRLAELEKELRHDVMAHVHHFGELAPEARPILHLGATSCYVTDNGDLMLYRRALGLVERRLRRVLRALAGLARRGRDLPCLGFTHYQPAQPVTVGKRACLWAQDFLLDLEEVRRLVDWLPCRGVKGTTGTQASFLALFDGDHDKVRRLEERVCAAIGFERAIPVSGQTYTRKIDWTIHQALSGIAQSAAKLGSDLRLLSHDGEVEEPSESRQIGSSAMAYKKNPMRCERICSLSRWVLAAADASAQTAAAQWLERTLDDSAVKRIALPESFLAVDAILTLAENVVSGLVLFPRVIERNLRAQLPFLATEEILMAGVRAGGDRQDLHERIRQHARAATARIKEHGEENPLLAALAADPAFAAIRAELPSLTDPARFIGRAPQQVDEFLREHLEPALGADEGEGEAPELRV